MKAIKFVVSILILAMPVLASQAASIQGHISTRAGINVTGALVSILSADTNRQYTVYSAVDGRYQIEVPYTGTVTLRIRTTLYNDVSRKMVLGKNTAQTVDVTLAALKNSQAQSDSLTASAHAATLQFSNDEIKTAFISQCNYCHQIGNSLTRNPRSHESWSNTVDRMMGYMALLSDKEKEGVTHTLSTSFQGKPIKNIQSYEFSQRMASAVVEEWFFGDGLAFPHDAEIGSDGLFYAVDEGHDLVWQIHPDTGRVIKYPLPEIAGIPKGGKFSALQLPIGVYNGKHGPHSMVEDDQGNFWITNALSSYISSFNIHTKKFKMYEIPGTALYPHTIRRDAKGIIWFTLAVSNQVGRFDPKTEQFTIIELPSNGFTRWLAEASTPWALKFFEFWPEQNHPLAISPQRWEKHGRDVANLPYGIDINPLDGSIWYAKLLANKLGRIDPITLEVEEIDVPLSGPRRPRFSKEGILWIPIFDHGAIMRFDPATREFKTYKMPTLAPGEWEAPYALNVHPSSGEVWITANTSDRLFSFDPTTEQFTAYPLPTRVTWMRDIVFSEDGKVCNSSSNLPAYAIETGRPSIICLDPNRH